MKKFAEWLTHFLGTTFGHMLGTALFSGILAYLKSLKDDVTLSYVVSNPKEIVSPLVVAFLLMALVAAILKYVQLRRTLRGFGARLFSKHGSDEEKKDDWTVLNADLAKASKDKSPLWLLGANGKDTFSSPTSPVCETLRGYAGSLRVLLIKPGSVGFARRVGETQANLDTYFEHILDTIDYCADLKNKKNKDIELRLYVDIPIWKMFITQQQVWLQHYHDQNHVDNTPMYCFEHVSNEKCLYLGFQAVFHKRWEATDTKIIDLGSRKRSDHKHLTQWL